MIISCLDNLKVNTRLRSNVTIKEQHATAALEVMSRFAANPKWLIYLPPTMSPSETSKKDKFLEYPEEAFSHFRSQGVPKVICEEKYMGSRAIVIICEDEEAVKKHFGIQNEGIGIVYTRTGRRFFNNSDLEQVFLNRIKEACNKAEFWKEFDTEWACFDCELMPWSEKAQDLLKSQYSAVGSAGMAALSETIQVLEQTFLRQDLEKDFEFPVESAAKEFDPELVLKKMVSRKNSISKYINAYQQYCWSVDSIDDLKLAPFHLLATNRKVHIEKDHEWHMNTLSKICAYDKEILLTTQYKIIDTTDEESFKIGCKWWEEITKSGGEGFVVKPFTFIAKGKKGLVQPAIKCRGREYLRIIYGPEYTAKVNLERLKSRSLGTKRSLALREFALGIEALERFVRKEPLRRVHECVFGVLALESEPVDPRL